MHCDIIIARVGEVRPAGDQHRRHPSAGGIAAQPPWASSGDGVDSRAFMTARGMRSDWSHGSCQWRHSSRKP
jgi:hypothetical protein